MNNSTTIPTITLYGKRILAKETKYGFYAKQFVNRTQAESAAAGILESEGIRCWVMQFMGRPFYVILSHPDSP